MTTEPSGVESPNCFQGDAMRLFVLEGSQAAFVYNYCSAYGQGSARLVNDARGRHYVLLEHSEGRGTRQTSNYLTIFEADGSLVERARLLVGEPFGFEADANYRFAVREPPDGGIVVSGTWSIDGALRPDDEAFARARAGRRSVIEIDTGGPTPRP